MLIQPIPADVPPPSQGPAKIIIQTKQDAGPVTQADASNAASDQLSKATPGQLHDAVNHLNQVMQQISTNLEFSIDQESRKTVVKVYDSETHKLIRQFPSEEAIAISKAIDKFEKGLLLSRKA